MDGITFIPGFVSDPTGLFHYLEANADWDSRMTARKTASYGVAYNYSQMHYPEVAFLPALQQLAESTQKQTGFLPNNCLINFYPDGKSRMGYHSDQTDILAPGTGIVIISLGETRSLRFRSIADPAVTHDFELPAGSLFYMTQEVQSLWQHAIPAADTNNGRISITFRKIAG